MNLLRPDETQTILNNYSDYSVDWFIDYFMKYDDDSDCKFIFKNLPPTLQTEINTKIQDYIRLVEQKREEVQRQSEEVQRQSEEVQRQSEEVQRQIRLSEDLNDLVLRQIDNTRELKRQLGMY
jgi:septal ring factor EnvC (AmiA/AmiB activator)